MQVVTRVALADIWDGTDTFSAPAVIHFQYLLLSGWHIAFVTLIDANATSRRPAKASRGPAKAGKAGSAAN